MKNIESLEKALQKEIELVEKHKQKAAAIEKELELKKGQMTCKAVKALKLDGKQYDSFLKLLENKKSVLEAVELVLAKEKVNEGGITNKNEEDIQ